MQSRTKLVSVVLTAVLMLVAASAYAGTINSFTFTDDAGSGISSDKIYTHLFDMGKKGSVVAEVNEVEFTLFHNNNSSANMTITHGNLTLTTVPVGTNSNGYNDSVNTNGVGVAADQGIFNLLTDYFYCVAEHQYQTATLTGLTPGQKYDLRFYYRNTWPASSQQTRSVDITFDVGGAEDFINVDENTPDWVASPPEGHYYASCLSYEYVAPSSGTLVVELDHITADNMAWAWCGMSNEVVVPEPSTLALLAAGLIGLLAYAWRKRR